MASRTVDILSKFHNTPSFIINNKLQLISLNERSEKLIGYSYKELAENNQMFLDIFSINIDTLSEALNNNSPSIIIKNVSIQTKLDDVINSSLIVIPFTEQSDNLYCVYILQDDKVMTLNESTATFEDILKGINASFMTIHLDNEGCITQTNGEFLKVSHWTPKRVLGKSFWNLFPQKEESIKTANAIWKAITTGHIWQGEVEKITKDGQPYWVFLTAIPYKAENDVPHYLLIEHNITKDKNIQLQLEKIAYIDTETGLMNIHRLEQEVNEMIEHERHFSFFYLSLDNFYTLKDVHNNEVNLVVEFTKRLKMYFQDSLMARINESDFVILTPLPEWFIQGFMNYLQQNPIYNGSTAIPLSLSGGITRYPEDQTKFAELIKASLATIATVREAGGGAILSLSKKTHEALNRKSLIEKRLLFALNHNNLKVFYQPQFDLNSGKIVAVEALVRWDDEEIGVVKPGELIPIAEETGLINNIGKFMLEQACEQAVKWKNEGKHLKISINFSVREFRDKNMAKSILDTLTKTGCPANLIQIEITEKFALEAEAAQDIIQQMRTLEDKGIIFVLDDFGTGYASLRYIQLLPISILKIDKMFIKSVLSSDKQQRLVHGMVQLGKSMNLTVLAEGVESEEQKELLQSIGCDAIQGYYVAKPMTAEEVQNILL